VLKKTTTENSVVDNKIIGMKHKKVKQLNIHSVQMSALHNYILSEIEGLATHNYFTDNETFHTDRFIFFVLTSDKTLNIIPLN
jgi:hypothetical protein